MKKILNPWLIIPTTILPLTFLILLMIRQFSLIRSLLESGQIQTWLYFTSALSLITFTSLILAGYHVIRKKDISRVSLLFILLSNLAYLYLFFNHLKYLLPFIIPRWMNGDLIVFASIALPMIPMTFSVIALAIQSAEKNEHPKIWKNIIIVLSIPLLWFIINQTILRVWNPGQTEFLTQSLIILMITMTVIFYYHLVKLLYHLLRNHNHFFIKNKLYFLIPITLILPMFGLLINNGVIPFQSELHSMFFGNFSHPWFYILTTLNALFLCIPPGHHPLTRLLLFFAKSITYCFSLYFFMIFLPMAPLSIVLIILIGIGFLVLAPLLLFIVHSYQLMHDFKHLSPHFGKKKTLSLLIIGLAVIPAIITIRYHQDRKQLDQMLEYTFYPDYEKEYNFNTEKAADLIGKLNNSSSGFQLYFNQNGQPGLDQYYQHIVLDDMILRRDIKDQLLETFAYGPSKQTPETQRQQTGKVKLTNIKTNTTYDTTGKYFVSNIELTLKADSTQNRHEYHTRFLVPAGTCINDYYLYILGKKVPGLLSEKKSAAWIYSQITSEGRDPGLLSYDNNSNALILNIFPFRANETRTTGFRLLHRNTFNLNIDNFTITLGDSLHDNDRVTRLNNITYISAKAKSKLPLVHRTPYLHFIVDCSQNGNDYKEDFIRQISQITSQKSEWAAGAKVSLCGTFTQTYPITSGWKTKLKNQPASETFFAERAMRKEITGNYIKAENKFPVFIILTHHFEKAILGQLADLAFAFPDNNIFYLAGTGQSLTACTLDSISPRPDIKEWSQPSPVRKYSAPGNKTCYLSDDSTPAITVTGRIDLSQLNNTGNLWEKGLYFQAIKMHHLLYPCLAATEWTDVVRSSQQTGILSTYTSFIALENDAQREMLMRKQKLGLKSNIAFDHGEYTMNMSEPAYLYALLGLILLFFSLFQLLRGKKPPKITPR